MADPKSEFENTSGGIISVVTIDGKGDPKGIPVWPEETVWLSKQEQALTSTAPRHPEDNPFEDGSLTLRTRAQDVPTARPIGDDQDMENPPEAAAPAPEEPGLDDIREEQAADPDAPELSTGAPAPPEGEPVEGGRAQNEETAEAPVEPPPVEEPPAETVSPEDEAKVEEAPLDTAAERGAGVRPSGSPMATPATPDPTPPPPEPESGDTWSG